VILFWGVSPPATQLPASALRQKKPVLFPLPFPPSTANDIAVFGTATCGQEHVSRAAVFVWEVVWERQDLAGVHLVDIFTGVCGLVVKLVKARSRGHHVLLFQIQMGESNQNSTWALEVARRVVCGQRKARPAPENGPRRTTHAPHCHGLAAVIY